VFLFKPKVHQGLYWGKREGLFLYSRVFPSSWSRGKQVFFSQKEDEDSFTFLFLIVSMSKREKNVKLDRSLYNTQIQRKSLEFLSLE
jgi:hypothetical protein